MSVVDGQAVNALITNAAFVSRTQNTSMSGNLRMEKIGAEVINDVQAAINASRRIERATQSISGAADIEYLNGVGMQLIPVQTSSGELIRNTITGTPIAFQEITLVGLSDTNYIKLESSDTDEGLMLNGDCLLKRFVTITLYYSTTLSRWVEKCRNI